jgi:hypothetical protein
MPGERRAVDGAAGVRHKDVLQAVREYLRP